MKDAAKTIDAQGLESDDEQGPLEIDDPLLAAAASLFNKRGFSEVTVEDAAKRAGVDIDEARRRFPSSAYLAKGIYEAVLDKIPKQIGAQGQTEATLHDSLCAIVIAEIQMLQPYKSFVARSILEFMNPTSTQLLLQIPTMQRLLAHVSEQIAVAKRKGAVGGWVIPNVAATMFGVLHAKIITYWLTVDDSIGGAKTLSCLDRDIGMFVRLLQNPLGFLNFASSITSTQPSGPTYKTRPIAGSASANPTSRRAKSTN